jgi:F-type H+-transporting ATPase subunit alpha
MAVENQVMALFAGGKGYLDDLPVERVQAFRDGFFEYVAGSHPAIGQAIVSEKKISDETEAALSSALDEYKKIFTSGEE